MVGDLPREQRHKALRYGIIGACVFIPYLASRLSNARVHLLPSKATCCTWRTGEPF